jgi:MFS family permease
MLKSISRNVWILSLVSLFTDAASEMLYPIMPLYLKTIGFSVILIGLLEGLAEATAGLSKGYFGNLSDASSKRLPFVQLGYAFSAISKPMLAIFTYPWWVFLARTTDRLGKGIRTGARDALLSEESTPGTKGKIFGFHRSMDTLGAVIGPAFALAFLYKFPGNYKMLFLIAFLPGLMAIFATLLLKEKRQPKKETREKVSFFTFLRYWKRSPGSYRRLVAGLLIFALFNSSDVFILLKAKASGLNDTQIIGTYIFYNLIFALAAFPLGSLADKIGLKKMFLAGLVLFSLVYFGMGFKVSEGWFIVLLFLYGMYAAATEGISKAWITNICRRGDVATAIGTYSAFQSICALIASSVAGLIWYNFGAAATFWITSGFTVLIVIYFFLYTSNPNPEPATLAGQPQN